MNARKPPTVLKLATINVLRVLPWCLAWLALIVIHVTLFGCPSHDEAKKPNDEGPAEDETGQEAEPAPKPSV